MLNITLLVLPNTINNANKRLNANFKGIIVPSVVWTKYSPKIYRLLSYVLDEKLDVCF